MNIWQARFQAISGQYNPANPQHRELRQAAENEQMAARNRVGPTPAQTSMDRYLAECAAADLRQIERRRYGSNY